MPWPLVSRRAFDLVLDECNRLRSQNDHLIETLTRLKRVEHGLSEAPRVPRKLEAIPTTIRHVIAGYDSAQVRRNLEIEVRRARLEGASWPEIGQRLGVRLQAEGEQEGPRGE